MTAQHRPATAARTEAATSVEKSCRLCHVRGGEGIIVTLAEQLS